MLKNDVSQKLKRASDCDIMDLTSCITSDVMLQPASFVEVDNNNGIEGHIPEKRIKLDEADVSEHSEDSDTLNPDEIEDFMINTFDVRRSFITVEFPTIGAVKETYPYLFTGKQILSEFLRISEIDIDHTIQEYCVKYALSIIDIAKQMTGTSEILKQAATAKGDNPALTQYWDMVTALCLVPYLVRENVMEMVLEIGETDTVDPRGKIVPMLVSKGNVFQSDEFFLIAEEEVLQEFEEFTIAFAALFASYWVFNMQYPKTLNSTYCFIQKGILKQRDEYPVPTGAKLLAQKIQKWGKDKKNKKSK